MYPTQSHGANGRGRVRGTPTTKIRKRGVGGTMNVSNKKIEKSCNDKQRLVTKKLRVHPKKVRDTVLDFD